MRNVQGVLALFALLFCSCDDLTGSKYKPVLVADSTKVLNINDFTVNIDHHGEIYLAEWRANGTGIICTAGLWVSAEQNGTFCASLVNEVTNPHSNFTSQWGNEWVGVFRINQAGASAVSNWPLSYGAPVSASGSPLAYGDLMCWSSLQSDTTIKEDTLLSQPIRGLRVTHASFGYARTDLQNVIFVRYEISNLSGQASTNAYVGFFADTDLEPGYERAGFDSTRSLAYVYADSTYFSHIPVVSGFKFLETPRNLGTFSHRIMKKNYYWDFGEINFSTPIQVHDALKGLSNLGLPMVNPITNTPTRYAFTGDPVARTGWLDTPRDVRSLISSGPFDLNTGETVRLTIAWVINDGASLAEALNTLKSKVDQIQNEVSLWQFQ